MYPHYCVALIRGTYVFFIKSIKSVDLENEVKVRWYMSGWHVSSMINLWTIYGDPRKRGNVETDLIRKTWHIFKSVDHENEVKVKWHIPGWNVTPMINVLNKYEKHTLCGKRETYLSQKLKIINVVVTAAKEAIPMSCHQRLLLQTRQNV